MDSMIWIGVFAVVLVAILLFSIYERGIARAPGIISDPVRTQPKAKWQVRLAGDWYECQPLGLNNNTGRLVRLTDKRTHSRVITRPLDEIRKQ